MTSNLTIFFDVIYKEERRRMSLNITAIFVPAIGETLVLWENIYFKVQELYLSYPENKVEIESSTTVRAPEKVELLLKKGAKFVEIEKEKVKVTERDSVKFLVDKWHHLRELNIIEDSEIVYLEDVGRYFKGTDFEINYSTGCIRRLGDKIPLNTRIEICYDYFEEM